MTLQPSRVVVVGGTAGIGLEVAKLAAARGAHVPASSASRSSTSAREAAPERRFHVQRGDIPDLSGFGWRILKADAGNRVSDPSGVL